MLIMLYLSAQKCLKTLLIMKYYFNAPKNV